MLNVKKKTAGTENAKTTTSAATNKGKGSKYDKQIAEKKEQIEVLKGEVKDLLAKKLNETSGDWEVGSTVYYPAPPQKNIIACKLEIEENSKGEIVYFVRPICVDKQGNETLSKRHYSLGTDLTECEDLYREPPKKAKKSTPAKSAKKSKDTEPEKPVKKATLGGKKKVLGKKK